jgi:hypothetical protein
LTIGDELKNLVDRSLTVLMLLSESSKFGLPIRLRFVACGLLGCAFGSKTRIRARQWENPDGNDDSGRQQGILSSGLFSSEALDYCKDPAQPREERTRLRRYIWTDGGRYDILSKSL